MTPSAHTRRQVVIRLGVAVAGMAAGVYAATLGHRLWGIPCAAVDAAAALLCVRLLLVGIPSRVLADEVRVRQVMEEHAVNLDGTVQVIEWSVWPVQHVKTSQGSTIMLSAVLVRGLDDATLAGMMRGYSAQGRAQLRASCTSASWERGLQWAAFLAPAFTAGPLIGTSVPLALSAAVAAWLLGRMVIAMVHAYQGERRDQAMAVVVGGADRWAQVLTASQQAADDARRRMHGRPPLQWLFGYFHYIPGRQSVSRRIARLTGDTTPP